MAGPTVTLTFAGDEKKLTDAMNRVGDASKSMSISVGKSSDDIKKSGKSLEDLRDKAGDTEQRFIGFKDTITGTGDVIAGFREGSILTMAQGFADIAGGLESFLLPALGALATFMKTQLLSAFSLIAAHPLILALIALAAVFVLLWTKSETFRDIVIGVFNAVSGFIRNVFGAVIDWIVGRWNDVIGFFAGLPGRIGAAISALGTAIGNGFKGALNLVIDYLNWWVDRVNNIIYGINLVNPFSDIPSLPHISRFHQGGVVGGAPGTEQLALLQAGETVTPANRVSTDNVVELRVTGNGALFEVLQAALTDGQLQLVGR